MAFLQYNDPLHIIWRSGKQDDPYIEKVDTFKIINNIIILSEIPSELDHVIIDGYVEVYSKEPLSNEFVINYQNGIATFNPTEEGKTVTANYMGRGIILYPSSRIYINVDDFGKIDRTLSDVVNNIDTVMDAVDSLDDSKAPTNHASSATTYGVASTSVYGHAKLSTAISSTSTSLAATPSAVKQAYDLANSKTKIVKSSTQPTGLSVGDVWIQTI